MPMHLDKQPLMLPTGHLLRERWTIENKIGCGGFGQICQAHDSRRSEQVAVKIGERRRDKDTARMVLEVKVFVDANKKNLQHIPKLYGSGQDPIDRPKINFIVMQLLSRSLSDQRRNSPLNRFTRATGVRCAYQAIEGLRELHSIGFIHRDIKPGNMVFGLDEPSKRILYLIDFGLVRRYLDDNGNVRPARPGRVGFRGTTRYASIRVLNRWEQCRADDMIAVFYTVLELINGSLPWRHYRDQSDVCESKKNYLIGEKYESLVACLPEGLKQIDKQLRSLEFEDEPEYSSYCNMLDQSLKELGASHNDPLDWENWTVVLDEERPKKDSSG